MPLSGGLRSWGYTVSKGPIAGAIEQGRVHGSLNVIERSSGAEVGVKASRRLTEVAPAFGAKYRIVGKLLGRSVESSYEITAFDRDRGFGGTTRSPMFGFSERYRFEPDGAGTRVSMSATVEPRGVFRGLRTDHRRLKALLEGP